MGTLPVFRRLHPYTEPEVGGSAFSKWVINDTLRVRAADCPLLMDEDKNVRAIFGTAVYFPDTGLRTSVQLWYFLQTGELRSWFTTGDLADPRFTTLVWIGGKSLEGIQYCTSLKTIAIAGIPGLPCSRRIVDLTPLANLPALETLVLNGNCIADLSPLAGIDTLRNLSLADNRIANLAPLSGLTGLVTLDVSGNRILDVTALSGLTEFWGHHTQFAFSGASVRRQ